MDAIVNALLRRTDRKTFFLDFASEVNLLLLIPERQKRASVPLRNLAFLHHLFHVHRQLQQTQQVGNRGSIDLNAARQFFLRALVLINVPLKRLSLFDRIEVLTLNILDNGQLSHLPIIDLANLHRHLTPVGRLSRTQAALASNEFESVFSATNDQRLQNAMSTDAIS